MYLKTLLILETSTVASRMFNEIYKQYNDIIVDTLASCVSIVYFVIASPC